MMFPQHDKLQFDRLVNTFSNSLVKFKNIQQVRMCTHFMILSSCTESAGAKSKHCILSVSQSTADMEQELLTRARTASLRKHVS